MEFFVLYSHALHNLRDFDLDEDKLQHMMRHNAELNLQQGAAAQIQRDCWEWTCSSVQVFQFLEILLGFSKNHQDKSEQSFIAGNKTWDPLMSRSVYTMTCISYYKPESTDFVSAHFIIYHYNLLASKGTDYTHLFLASTHFLIYHYSSFASRARIHLVWASNVVHLHSTLNLHPWVLASSYCIFFKQSFAVF